MKKIISVIFASIGLVAFFSACGGETYADKLEDEEKAIDRFIRDNGIEVIYTYPDKHQFADNQYYRDASTGIYIHVIDSGGKDKPTKSPVTDITLRYDSVYNMLTNEVEATPNWASSSPMSFTYGNPYTYSNSTNDYATSYYLLSQGCVIPLEFGLGNQAEVKLIIPFENGSTYQQSSYVPLYYSRLIYKFLKDEPED